MSGLPVLGGRSGNFEIDDDYMRKCNAELDKLNEISELDSKMVTKEEDGRSMLEVMREKRAATEKQIEEQ